MGRRALPKLRTDVDFSRHFLTREVLATWAIDAWFPRHAPLEVEVGSGKGMFLRTFGAKHPERNFLGIEVAFQYARYAAYRAAQSGLENVRAANGDAVAIFAEVIPSSTLSAVHVYFPDPWWKARHKKRRVLCDTFLKSVERVLLPGGVLHFWTDVEEYYHTTLELIAAETKLAGPLPVAVPTLADGTPEFRTHRDRRVHLAGLPVYRAEFVRRPATE